MEDLSLPEPYRKRTIWKLRADACPKPQPWRWPLAPYGHREPVVLFERPDNARRTIDLGFGGRPIDSDARIPVLAAQDAEVMLAAQSQNGFLVSLHHKEQGYVTHYARMSRMCVSSFYGQRRRRREWIRGGDCIGYIQGANTLRFEVWRWTNDRGYVAVDPVAKLTEWSGAVSTIAKAA